jgi:hypothetical protein
LVQNNFINPINLTSGNEIVDNFIQEMQFKDIKNYNNAMFEWIPYEQFNEIKEIGKNNSITVCSAIWKNNLLYNQHNKYLRYSNKKVALIYLQNSQNTIEIMINKV